MYCSVLLSNVLCEKHAVLNFGNIRSFRFADCRGVPPAYIRPHGTTRRDARHTRRAAPRLSQTQTQRDFFNGRPYAYILRPRMNDNDNAANEQRMRMTCAHTMQCNTVCECGRAHPLLSVRFGSVRISNPIQSARFDSIHESFHSLLETVCSAHTALHTCVHTTLGAQIHIS